MMLVLIDLFSCYPEYWDVGLSYIGNVPLILETQFLLHLHGDAWVMNTIELLVPDFGGFWCCTSSY
uniref:Uncharacterized protein n=1 Tax=Arundo donax TaxID=35708 RepID=A0A0A9G4U9_ARUDO